jgi:hypothetical protein
MSKKDFQNGFALGLASKGKISQKLIKGDSKVSGIFSPKERWTEDSFVKNYAKVNSDVYYPVQLPLPNNEITEKDIFYIPEDSSFKNSTVFNEITIDNKTEGVYYKNASDDKYKFISDFKEKNALKFKYIDDPNSSPLDYPAYIAESSKIISLEERQIYRVTIDEGTSNEFVEFIYTASPSLGSVSFFDGMFWILPKEDGEGTMFMSYEERFLGTHTLKIEKRKIDSYPRYCIRIYDDCLIIDILDIFLEGEHTFEVINEQGENISNTSRKIEIQERLPGQYSGVLWDSTYRVYKALQTGEKLTFKLKDASGKEILSSSNVKKSQLSGYAEGTPEGPEGVVVLPNGKVIITCYCWGNEYIYPGVG